MMYLHDAQSIFLHGLDVRHPIEKDCSGAIHVHMPYECSVDTSDGRLDFDEDSH